MIVIGIDPGKEGAIACIGESGIVVGLVTMPLITSTKDRSEYDEASIRDAIETSGHVVVYEILQPLPAKMGGGVTNYQRGLVTGLLRGLVAGMRVASTAVRPQEWQRVMLAGTSGTDTKQRAVVAAGRLFPGVCLVCYEIGGTHRDHGQRRKKRDGGADALLIAEFGRRRLAGELRADMERATA